MAAADAITLMREDPQGVLMACQTRRGVAALNARMQHALNPPHPDRPSVPGPDKVAFRRGDLVCARVNEYDARGVRTVTNGARGTVTVTDPQAGMVHVQFHSECPNQTIPAKSGKIDLAYAASVHRLQGQEADGVVLVLDMTPQRQNRANLYSGCTRAKREVRVHTTEERLQAALDDTGAVHRRTRLAENLRRRLQARKRPHGLLAME